MNIEKKQVEVKINSKSVSGINDFRIFGEKESRVACLTGKGLVHLLSFNYSLRKINTGQSYKIVLNPDSEKGVSLAVCDQSKYILASTKDLALYNSSRLIILKVEGHRLVEIAALSLQNQGIGPQYAIESFGYSGRHILWVGISSMSGDASVHLYDFDTQTRTLRSLWTRGLERTDCLL